MATDAAGLASRDSFLGVALETFEAGCAVRVAITVTLTLIQFRVVHVGRDSQIHKSSAACRRSSQNKGDGRDRME